MANTGGLGSRHGTGEQASWAGTPPGAPRVTPAAPPAPRRRCSRCSAPAPWRASAWSGPTSSRPLSPNGCAPAARPSVQAPKEVVVTPRTTPTPSGPGTAPRTRPSRRHALRPRTGAAVLVAIVAPVAQRDRGPCRAPPRTRAHHRPAHGRSRSPVAAYAHGEPGHDGPRPSAEAGQRAPRRRMASPTTTAATVDATTATGRRRPRARPGPRRQVRRRPALGRHDATARRPRERSASRGGGSGDDDRNGRHHSDGRNHGGGSGTTTGTVATTATIAHGGGHDDSRHDRHSR